MVGVVAFRPAAAFRRAGMDRLVPLSTRPRLDILSELSEELKVDTSRPGRLKLGFEDIEWVICGVGFGRDEEGRRGTTMHMHRVRRA